MGLSSKVGQHLVDLLARRRGPFRYGFAPRGLVPVASELLEQSVVQGVHVGPFEETLRVVFRSRQ